MNLDILSHRVLDENFSVTKKKKRTLLSRMKKKNQETNIKFLTSVEWDLLGSILTTTMWDFVGH